MAMYLRKMAISQCELWTDNTDAFQSDKKIINYSLQLEKKLSIVAESTAHYDKKQDKK